MNSNPKANLIPRIIKELKANEIIWNVNHPQFRVEVVRNSVLRDSARRLGISRDRLLNLTTYLKKEFHKEERKRRNLTNKKEWKWYRQVTFLKDGTHFQPRYLTPTVNQADEVRQPDSSSRAEKSSERSEDEQSQSSNQLGSTSRVYIINPDTGIICKSEDEASATSPIPNNHSDDPDDEMVGISTIPRSESESEDPIAARPPSITNTESGNKKLLIDSACSSMKFYLTNANVSEDQLLSFHGDMMKFMHSYFRNNE